MRTADNATTMDSRRTNPNRPHISLGSYRNCLVGLHVRKRKSDASRDVYQPRRQRTFQV